TTRGVYPALNDGPLSIGQGTIASGIAEVAPAPGARVDSALCGPRGRTAPPAWSSTSSQGQAGPRKPHHEHPRRRSSSQSESGTPGGRPAVLGEELRVHAVREQALVTEGRGATLRERWE